MNCLIEDDFWCMQLFILSAILNLFTNIKEINKTLLNIFPQVSTTILRQCTSEKEHFDISHVYVQIHENSAMYIMSVCTLSKSSNIIGITLHHLHHLPSNNIISIIQHSRHHTTSSPSSNIIDITLHHLHNPIL